MIFITQQVLTTLGWIVLMLAISPILVWRGYVEVPSPTTAQRIYRVPRARGYVQVIENGRAVMRLCVQPVECLPDADVVVLHKLMIEANEEHYLQKANKYLCTD